MDTVNFVPVRKRLRRIELQKASRIALITGLISSASTLYQGHIYKYLGDGAILVWPAKVEHARNVDRMLEELLFEIGMKSEWFNHKYGEVPGITAGVHSEPVIKGGLGVIRKEMGVWGRNVNLTARLQGACKAQKADRIYSAEFYQLMDKECEGLHTDHIELKGIEKDQPIYSKKYVKS